MKSHLNQNGGEEKYYYVQCNDNLWYNVIVEVTNMNSMIEATKVLHHYNELAHTRLSNIKSKSEYEVNFFGEVKPYVDQFFNELDMWTDLVTKWLKETKPKYIHINQVDTLRENLQNVVLQSFYQETRDKRFKQMYQSNKYVLESILMND